MQKYTFLHGRMGCIMFGGGITHYFTQPKISCDLFPPPRCPNFNHSGKERAVLPESTSKLAELQKVWDGMCPSPPPGSTPMHFYYCHILILHIYSRDISAGVDPAMFFRGCWERIQLIGFLMI